MVRQRTILLKGGTATASVYCLKTDAWNDYLALMRDAEAASKDGRVRDMNRFLRAAITCLFSHVEGVVNDIVEQKSIVGKRQSLCEKAWAIRSGSRAVRRDSVRQLSA